MSENTAPDYQRCTLLIGLKEILGAKIIDYLKIPHIYESYENINELYGLGFTYSKILKDSLIDRNNIEERIKNREFEYIVYGSVHRSLPFHQIVKKYCLEERIFYVCGEDAHLCEYAGLPIFFCVKQILTSDSTLKFV